MSIYLEDNPTCQRREWLPVDQDWATGQPCGKPASWIDCSTSPVCAEHQCRCRIPIQSRLAEAEQELGVILAEKKT
jgi:hypothetical protein